MRCWTAMCEFVWLNTVIKSFCFSNRVSRGVPMVDTRHGKKSLTVPATQHSPRVVLGDHEFLAPSNNTKRMVRPRPANSFGWKASEDIQPMRSDAIFFVQNHVVCLQIDACDLMRCGLMRFSLFKITLYVYRSMHAT